MNNNEFGPIHKDFLLSQTDISKNVDAAKDFLMSFIDQIQFKSLDFLDIGSGSGLYSLAACKIRFCVLLGCCPSYRLNVGSD